MSRSAAPTDASAPVRLNLGCGLDVVPGYDNLDNSPSLRIQTNLLLRGAARLLEALLGRQLYTRFPAGVRWCDAARGLPYARDSVEVIYSSHMLEHLPREEAETFLRETYRVLAPGGRLRLAVPDLERKARVYLAQVARLRAGSFDGVPADQFVRSVLLGAESSTSWRRPPDLYRAIVGRGGHAWMWDAPSLVVLLRQIGFREAGERGFRESTIPQIEKLESEVRREESVYVEAEK